ncbi:glycerophosphodiester phosphodiesterase family protein [Gracilibacillus sp. S3-1-1]|uniref:Glycerophosphodiester phosphodiesterase family protein n=1 Tax=Gracilibacillus pellucidus TaxID=3095368 RepID=A0ACC6M9T0_9BACI|nr:glycerophosphodiester phosphodiesterase family protein [Gracilibacillus sp. S3-1-1]MDX8047694.1 glycerophosphodiester phosphodiesterase family protein [Gracilibacillus sp. S3-1-1]
MMNRFLFIFFIIVFFMFVFSVPAFASEQSVTFSKKDQQKMINVAHRGASGHAPENTMAAFQKAVEMKADYFEIDVQMTKDGELVIIHDTTVNRTTNGTGAVGDLTFEEIRSLDAGSWFDEKYAGEKIPTFEEVLDAFRGKIGILVELKSPELYPGIEEKIATVLKERNMDRPNNKKIIIQSFNHDSVQQSKTLLPNLPHGVLAGPSWRNVTDEQLKEFATYADYFNPNMNIVTTELVNRVHATGMLIMPYTSRSQKQADRLFHLGVDGIVTDYPEHVYKHPVK